MIGYKSITSSKQRNYAVQWTQQKKKTPLCLNHYYMGQHIMHCIKYTPHFRRVRRLRKVTVRCVISVSLSAWKNPFPTRRIFMKFCIWRLFENCWEDSSFILKSDKKYGYLTWKICTFMTISRWILRRICREPHDLFHPNYTIH